MHKYLRHLGDYAKATGHLSMLEHGAYTLLLDLAYSREAPLPVDEMKLFKLCRARTAAEKSAVRLVVEEFFELTTEGWVQSRVMAEIAEYQCKSSKSRDAAAKRWENERNADALHDESGGNASRARTNNQQPITNNQGTPGVPKGTALMGDVAEAVYELYPKKVGKVKAIAAIVKVLKSGTITELDLQERVKAYAEATAMWAEQDKTYIPYPATWFNQQRYLDDPATWTRQPSQAEKKERGGGPPQTVGAAPLAELPVAPEGWEDAMPELYGPGWREHYGAFEMMLTADQRQVRAWLVANRGQAAMETR